MQCLHAVSLQRSDRMCTHSTGAHLRWSPPHNKVLIADGIYLWGDVRSCLHELMSKRPGVAISARSMHAASTQQLGGSLWLVETRLPSSALPHCALNPWPYHGREPIARRLVAAAAWSAAKSGRGSCPAAAPAGAADVGGGRVHCIACSAVGARRPHAGGARGRPGDGTGCGWAGCGCVGCGWARDGWTAYGWAEYCWTEYGWAGYGWA